MTTLGLLTLLSATLRMLQICSPMRTEDDDRSFTTEDDFETRALLRTDTAQTQGSPSQPSPRELFHIIAANDVYKIKPALPRKRAYVLPFQTTSTYEQIYTAIEEGCNADPLRSSCFPGAIKKWMKEIDWTQNESFSQETHVPILDGCRATEDTGWPSSSASARLREKANEGSLFGGLRDMGLTYLKLRADAESVGSHVISILPGDFLSPSYFALVTQGRGIVEVLNRAKLDAVAFGNHDFDFARKCEKTKNGKDMKWSGKSCIVARMVESNFLWLGANTFENGTSNTVRLGSEINLTKSMDTGFASYTTGSNSVDVEGPVPEPEQHFTPSEFVLEYGYNPRYIVRTITLTSSSTKRICMFGTTDKSDTSGVAQKQGQAAEFTDEIREAIAILDELHSLPLEQRCDFVIAMTHSRSGKDLKLWKKMVEKQKADSSYPHIDVMQAAHDHYLAFMNMISPANGRKTLIWKNGADSHFMSRITLNLATGGLQSYGIVPIYPGECQDDANMEQLVNGWNSQTRQGTKFPSPAALLSAKLPIVFHGLYDTTDARVKETRAINMWMDIFRESPAGGAIPADVAVLPGACFRSDQFETKNNQFSKLDVWEEFNQPKELAAVAVSAAELVILAIEGLSHASTVAEDPNNYHWSGIRLTYRSQAHTVPGLCRTNSSAKFGGLIEVEYVGQWHQLGSIVRSNGPASPRSSGCDNSIAETCRCAGCVLWRDGVFFPDAQGTEESKTSESWRPVFLLAGQMYLDIKPYGSTPAGLPVIQQIAQMAQYCAINEVSSTFSSGYEKGIMKNMLCDGSTVQKKVAWALAGRFTKEAFPALFIKDSDKFDFGDLFQKANQYRKEGARTDAVEKEAELFERASSQKWPTLRDSVFEFLSAAERSGREFKVGSFLNFPNRSKELQEAGVELENFEPLTRRRMPDLSILADDICETFQAGDHSEEASAVITCVCKNPKEMQHVLYYAMLPVIASCPNDAKSQSHIPDGWLAEGAPSSLDGSLRTMLASGVNAELCS